MSKEKFTPFVPDQTDLKEFTVRAVILGLFMTAILGAANAYLGLRAGMTIAATYPAAVIGMAILKLVKGSILEENIARTIGSIGESIAAGAIFTIPAFVISGVWKKFDSFEAYWKSSALMLVGGVLGILFVTVLRKVMVEDPELPFPESIAASEIHKAGQRGGEGAKYLFQAMGVGSLIYLLGVFKFFSASKDFIFGLGKSLNLSIGKLKLAGKELFPSVKVGGKATFAGPAISPAYIGVGYIIGPELAALNFAGGVLAWGLFVPLVIFFTGPNLSTVFPVGSGVEGAELWYKTAILIWKSIVRPIAVGGMLVGAVYTLYKMRKNLALGMKRAVSDVKKAAKQETSTRRTDKDLNFRVVAIGLFLTLIAMTIIYYVFTHSWNAALTAALVMAVAGFFFAAVSGNLVGLIGSSNNPISGLTLSTLIVAALLMLVIGAKGTAGIAAVLGVAAVVCVSSAVAGEMLQDLKVGHILGGTPWKMQVGDLIGVLVGSLIMYFPLLVLHVGDIKGGGEGFGGKALPAPQAGLMADLTKGIVGGHMAWLLVVVGILMGTAFIMVKVKSPMLVAVGMYLPLETTFAIFIGGMIRWIIDSKIKRKNFNENQKARVENTGVLLASGLIAGEALTGLVIAALKFFDISIPAIFKHASYLLGLVFLVIIGYYLVALPLKKAGDPDEPATQIAE